MPSAIPASPDPTPGPPPQGGGLRARVESASLPLLRRLVRLPRSAPFLVMLGLLLAGLLVGGAVGSAALALVALVVLWLTYLSWPRLNAVQRLGRAAVLTLAVAMCVVQLFPRR